MNWLKRFLSGRYGPDQLSLFLLMAYFVLYLISCLLRVVFLRLISLVPLFLALARTLSRNVDRRAMENARFLAVTGPAVRWLKLRRTILRDKDHRYFRCPNCGQQLRVPKGKGKITVTCRSCGVSFEGKS